MGMKTERQSEQKRAKWRGSNFERATAKKVHGVVVGRSKAVKVGDKWIQTNCQQPPDVVTECFSFECKYMKELPKGELKAMSQSIRNAPDGLTPVSVLGDRQGNRVYLMTEADWLAWHVGHKAED